MRYQFIQQHQDQFPVRAQCRVLNVSASGFYAWQQRQPSQQKQANLLLSVQVRAVFEKNRCCYGSPRIHQELQAQGIRCSQKRVARLMKAENLRARTRRAFKVTTDSAHALPVARNLLAQQFQVAKKNQVWCSDITYIPTAGGWLYLAVVLDLYSRRIVGWALRPHLERELVCAAFSMARSQSGKVLDLLHHSDQGSQYASLEYQKLLATAGVQCSMSRRGNCWDNAPVESFFATLKQELVYRQRFETRAQAQAALFDYIEVFYNRQRRHSALGYLCPVAFEDRQPEHLQKVA
jgi:transposase InsO family protein